MVVVFIVGRRKASTNANLPIHADGDFKLFENTFPVPQELWEGDLPDGCECELFVGRLIGELKPISPKESASYFTFEIPDVNDPTEFVLRYNTYGAPAEALARWENAGDTVGIVIATTKLNRMAMVQAYNFTRKKWFTTAYYPHRKDMRPGQNVSLTTIRTLIAIGAPTVIVGGIGIIPLIISFYLQWLRTKQFNVLNPPDYRGATGQRIADWITANADTLLAGGPHAIDPSL